MQIRYTLYCNVLHFGIRPAAVDVKFADCGTSQFIIFRNLCWSLASAPREVGAVVDWPLK